MATAPGKRLMATDVCVPVSQLPDAIHNARVAVAERGLQASIVGHVGDGNYHFGFMVDPDSPGEVAVARQLNELEVPCAGARRHLYRRARRRAGEDRLLKREHGDALPVMRALKQVLDPNGVLNPGKVLPAQPA